MSTGPFAALSRAMLRGYVRDRAALVFSILIPVVFLLLFGSLYKDSGSPSIAVLQVGRSALLTEARAHSPALAKVLDVKPASSLGPALADVRKGTDDAAVRQQGGHLTVWYSIASPTTAGVVESVFSSIVGQANIDASGRPPAYHLSAQQVQDRSVKPIQYIAPGLLGWAIASGGAFGAASTLVGWRENKLLRRLRLAPVSTTSVVAARIGVSVMVALLQMVVFIVVATTPFFGMKLSGAWWMAVPVVVCGTLAFLSIGLLVGAVAKSQQAAGAIANLVILPMGFLGGAFVPLAYAPQWLREVSYIMPLRYLVIGMQDVMAIGLGPASALPAIGVLLGFAAVATFVAVRVFRWDQV